MSAETGIQQDMTLQATEICCLQAHLLWSWLKRAFSKTRT